MSLCIPGMLTADLLDEKQMVKTLDQWDCVVEWNCRASKGLPSPPQRLDWGSNRSLCCKEEEDLQGVEWNPEGNVWSQLAFHIVGKKPSEASHCQHGAYGEASD